MRFNEHEVLAHSHWRTERFEMTSLWVRYGGVFGCRWRMVDEAEAIALAGGDGS